MFRGRVRHARPRWHGHDARRALPGQRHGLPAPDDRLRTRHGRALHRRVRADGRRSGRDRHSSAGHALLLRSRRHDPGLARSRDRAGDRRARRRRLRAHSHHLRPDVHRQHLRRGRGCGWGANRGHTFVKDLDQERSYASSAHQRPTATRSMEFQAPSRQPRGGRRVQRLRHVGRRGWRRQRDQRRSGRRSGGRDLEQPQHQRLRLLRQRGLRAERRLHDRFAGDATTCSRPTPSTANWDYRIVYEAWIALDAFGDSGFGQAFITYVHSSPGKGIETINVGGEPCPPEWDTPYCPPDVSYRRRQLLRQSARRSAARPVLAVVRAKTTTARCTRQLYSRPKARRFARRSRSRATLTWPRARGLPPRPRHRGSLLSAHTEALSESIVRVAAAAIAVAAVSLSAFSACGEDSPDHEAATGRQPLEPRRPQRQRRQGEPRRLAAAGARTGARRQAKPATAPEVPAPELQARRRGNGRGWRARRRGCEPAEAVSRSLDRRRRRLRLRRRVQRRNRDVRHRVRPLPRAHSARGHDRLRLLEPLRRRRRLLRRAYRRRGPARLRAVHHGEPLHARLPTSRAWTMPVRTAWAATSIRTPRSATACGCELTNTEARLATEPDATRPAWKRAQLQGHTVHSLGWRRSGCRNT